MIEIITNNNDVRECSGKELSPQKDLKALINDKLIIGGGEAIIYLSDNKQENFGDQIEKYKHAVQEIGCSWNPQFINDKKNNGWFLIRRKPKSVEDILEIRVAVIGNVDAGKSTMLGVLTNSQLDDGRGKARVGLFRHKHELETGRTSSIGQETLAFNEEGEVLVGKRNHPRDSINPLSHKVINFIDLAGHERYLKTTMYGLTGYAPDYAMLMVGANAGIIGMAKEHLALAFALSTPTFVVITKIDMAPQAVLEGNIRTLTKLLKGSSCKKVSVIIKTKEEMMLAIENFISQRLCPIFQVSNVTGVGLDLLKDFLHLLPCEISASRYGDANGDVEFQITEDYTVPGAGTVVAGTLISGTVKLGQTLFLGPDHSGNYVQCTIKGIQRKRMQVDHAYPGQCASFALKKIKRSTITKGMVLVSKSLAIDAPLASHSCMEFEAEIVILFHSTTLAQNYQAMMHCGVIRQTVMLQEIISIQDDHRKKDKNNYIPLIRTGDRAIVRFRFIKSPQFMKIGARLIFREGRTKGVGKVTRLLD